MEGFLVYYGRISSVRRQNPVCLGEKINDGLCIFNVDIPKKKKIGFDERVGLNGKINCIMYPYSTMGSPVT